MLEELSAHFDARSGVLRLMDTDCQQVSFSTTFNYDQAYIAAYRDHFVNIDPLNPLLRESPGSLVVMTPSKVLPGFKNSEYYNDYARPQDIEHAAGTAIIHDGSRTAAVGIQRSASQNAFQSAEIEAFRLLLPHLRRSLEIFYRTAHLEQLCFAAEQALDQLPFGSIVLDAHAKVSFISRSASAILDAERGVFIKQGVIQARHREESSRLKSLLWNAVGLGKTPNRIGGAVRLVHSCSISQPLNVVVAPLNPEESSITQQWPSARALVFLGSSTQSKIPDEITLKALYGITRAETRVAAKLAEGMTIEAIADHHQVSRNTVRTQLRQLLRKTDTQRQAELVGLLLSLPKETVSPR